jgi:hypothetical protein
MEKLDTPPAELYKPDQTNKFDFVMRWLAELAISEKKCGYVEKHAGINAIIHQLGN